MSEVKTMEKTVEAINKRIDDGNVKVVTAEEMCSIVDELGPEKAVKEVDVVTTGTFGAMCSSGAFFNFGHSDPPIKMQRIWMNDVEAYTGVAAVDAYMGATQLSESRGFEYGGGHVIEDLVRGKSVLVRAISHGTDCYPRKQLETELKLSDMNQAVMLNPRNAYQRYNAATNSSDKTLYTYMGTLLPRHGNVTFSGAGCLSPLYNDPTYETIGLGTRMFIGGSQGYVIGEGTQHNPKEGMGTIMVRGNLKEMDAKYLRGATVHKYGTTLYVGIGIPIPVLNPTIAKATAIKDKDIVTNLLDYAVQKRSRPVLRKVTYAELKSGFVDIEGKDVKVSPLSSTYVARDIARTLKSWIANGKFHLTEPVERLRKEGEAKPMKQTREQPKVKDVMTVDIPVASSSMPIREAAKALIKANLNHLPVVSEDRRLIGIVTSWDISRAVALDKFDRVEEIMTKKVITAYADDEIDIVARRLKEHDISALPVIDIDKKLLGIVTTEDVSKLLARRERK